MSALRAPGAVLPLPSQIEPPALVPTIAFLGNAPVPQWPSPQAAECLGGAFPLSQLSRSTGNWRLITFSQDGWWFSCLTQVIGGRKQTHEVHLSWEIFGADNGKRCSVWQNTQNFPRLLCYHGQHSPLANTNQNWVAWGVLLTHKPNPTARTSLPLTWSDVDSDADIGWAGWHCKQGSGAGDQPPSLSLHSWTPSSSTTKVPFSSSLLQSIAPGFSGGPSHAFHADSIVPCVMCQYFLFSRPFLSCSCTKSPILCA